MHLKRLIVAHYIQPGNISSIQKSKVSHLVSNKERFLFLLPLLVLPHHSSVSEKKTFPYFFRQNVSWQKSELKQHFGRENKWVIRWRCQFFITSGYGSFLSGGYGLEMPQTHTILPGRKSTQELFDWLLCWNSGFILAFSSQITVCLITRGPLQVILFLWLIANTNVGFYFKSTQVAVNCRFFCPFPLPRHLFWTNESS